MAELQRGTAWIILLTGLSLLSGCVNAKQHKMSSFVAPKSPDSPRGFARAGSAQPQEPAKLDAELPMNWVGDEPPRAREGQGPQVVEAARRIMVYEATLQIVVADIPGALQKARQRAEAAGGYVSASSGDSITIKVPADRYESILTELEAFGRVADRHVEAQDVTENYVDLEARLKNALAVRERLDALLKQATNVEAALKVEVELKRVGEEIEQLQARLEVLKNRVAFSSITATFQRVAQQQTIGAAVRLPFAWLHQLDPNALYR